MLLSTMHTYNGNQDSNPDLRCQWEALCRPLSGSEAVLGSSVEPNEKKP
jgi:hypothetical protein